MRPTQLGFRNPNERTAELNTECWVNREGKKYDIRAETKQNPKGSNLPREQRFKAMNFYDRGTGQSVFIGPGSYEAIEAHKKLTQIVTPGIIVSPAIETNNAETNQQHSRQRKRSTTLHNDR